MSFKTGWTIQGGDHLFIGTKQSQFVECVRLPIQAGIVLFLMLLPLIADATSTIVLPRTGQIWSYDVNTPKADDGNIVAGVTWPSPRFTNPDGTVPVNGDIVLDKLTGLQWPKMANAPAVTGTTPCAGGTKTWQAALDYVACLNVNKYLGHNDWHLPNLNELESIVNAGQPNTATWLNEQGFSSVQPSQYWSSSTYARDTSVAWNVHLHYGAAYNYYGKSNKYYVWPVRSGQCGAPDNSVICLPKTGQTTSYDTNTPKADDGAIQSGVTWPSPRFTNPDGTTPINRDIVLDQLTGLQWPKIANTPAVTGATPCVGGEKTWQAALDYVVCLNANAYLGQSDWRLPNSNELKHLVNAEQPVTATWLNGQGFINVQPTYYWSSTSDSSDTSNSWVVEMNCGRSNYSKNNNYYVWPVRSGQFGNPDKCSFALSPSGEGFIHSGGIGSVSVATSGSCAWTASSNASWLKINSDSSGAGNGKVNFTVSPHSGTGQRTGTMTIAGQAFTVTQPDAAVDSAVRLPQSGQAAKFFTGDDGDLLKGVAWPSPRFTNPDGTAPINGDIVLDKLTGLQWPKMANTSAVTGRTPCDGGTRKWQAALNYVACLNTNMYLGHNDWRLPNINELQTLLNAGQSDIATWLNTQGFNFVLSSYYWSSTSVGSNTSNAWGVGMGDGIMGGFDKGINSYVWPVRAGQCGGSDNSVICLPKTGQIKSFDANTPPKDDGAVKAGVAWPDPRFIDNANGTMTDSLTGLIWIKDAYTPEAPSCNSGPKTWQDALAYAACLNASKHLGYDDWRLPNILELSSLVNSGQLNPANWLNGKGFRNIQPRSYWSSTTFSPNFVSTRVVDFNDGSVSSYGKGGSVFVLCVRTGQSGTLRRISTK